MNLQITGDPFIDAGKLAAEKIFQHLKLKGARDGWLKAVNWAADKYQNKWNSSIDSISLNGPVTHNTQRKRARKEAPRGRPSWRMLALKKLAPWIESKQPQGDNSL